MADDDLLNIGAFSVLTGLSIAALRHYDEVGLLRPALGDPRSGYRRYRFAQLPSARTIGALRAVDVPIDTIRDALAAGDDAAVEALLGAHREQLVERGRAVSQMLATLDDYIENGVRMRDATGCRIVEINLGVTDLQAAKKFYEAAFGVEFAEEQHDGGALHLFASFGTWPSDRFFLLNLGDASFDPERTGKGNFGFVVDDLDAAHKRAVAAGGAELFAPRDVSGMPRVSTVLDPSGNLINLYQDA